MNHDIPILVKTPTVMSQTIILKQDSTSINNEAQTTNMVLVNGGSAYVVVRGISYTLNVGDIIIIPRMAYRVTHTAEEEAMLVVLSLSDFQFSGSEKNEWPFLKNETLLSADASTEPIAGVIGQIDSELSGLRFGYEKSSARLAEYLVILLQRYFTADESNEIEPVSLMEKVKDYIDANYEKNLTLNSLSEVFFVSPYHIAHLFKERFDISPIQYLIQTRIRVASDLLAQTSATVFEISNAVGYPNVNYFHILFKRFAGMSPGRYRKLARKRP